MTSPRTVLTSDCNSAGVIASSPARPHEAKTITATPAAHAIHKDGPTNTRASNTHLNQRRGVRRNRRPLDTITTADFLELELPEPTWTVEEMLSAGVSVLGGAPKVGKSWLVLQLAHAVATGNRFLDRTVNQGRVLLLVLEGNKSFFQERVRKVFRDDRPTNIHLAFEADHLHSGLENQIDEFLVERQDTKLVIVDTLVRVHPKRASGRTQYNDDAATLRGMEVLARDHPEVAFVFVHHTREMVAEDPLDALSGSRGLTGTIENGWILGKPQNVATPVLQTSGRNLPESKKLAVEFDLDTCLWSVKGDARNFPTGATRRAIVEYLDTMGEDGARSSDIVRKVAEAVGGAESSVRKTLSLMLNARQIERVSGGVYRVAS